MAHKHFITHIELLAKNLDEVKNFYSDVFEWKITDYPEMNYASFEAEGGSGGGFNPASVNNPTEQVLIYINTPDLKDTLAKIKAAGGTVLMESYDIPGVGTMATFNDPSGNLVALLQPLME